MASLIDRLLGRTETALTVYEPQAIEAKAAIGPGVFAMMNGTPLHSFSRDPHRLMAEAQALYHTNVWVNAAERAIVDRFTRIDWHLEDDDGDTVDETSPAPYQAVLRLLERPSKTKTRRQLWGLTLRHNGLCGNAAWLLDQRDALADTPLETLYVNPVRLTPKTDPAGNIVGWVLDDPDNPIVARYSQSPGIPLLAEEVIHFTLHEPDWGPWGIGVAEAAQRKIQLDNLTDTHAGGVLAAGGRLSGMITPKTGQTVNDDQWVQFVRDWRSITSDPDAAKRLQIAKMPLDFTQMTASPKDLQLVDVARGNRDDILAAWGVPGSQIGIMSARGMNSGETVKYEEAALWQGAIEPRAEAFREKVQTELLDRFAALGVTVTLVLDYPSFDDEAPLYENASKAKLIPLTNNERRALVGLDPLEDEELGNQIYLASEMNRVDESKEPTPPVPPAFPQIAAATDEETEVVEGKADFRKPLLGLRSRTETTWEPKLRATVARVLGEQERYVVSRAAHLLAKPTDKTWWNEEREAKRLSDALDPLIVDLAREVANRTGDTIRKPEGKADGFLDRVVELVRRSVGARILGINATTRDKVTAAVAQGIEAGWSPAVLAQHLRESAAFDEARAEMISRTETMNVYNDAALGSYQALDVTEVEAIDGDDDAECAARNGKRFPIDEAYGIADHPNGTLDWMPVVK